MPTFYNCKHDGDQYRISKFTADLEVESSYLCTLGECECPAGVRPSCRHRDMLHKFIRRNHIGDDFFYDFDRGGWVQMDLSEPRYGIGPMMAAVPLIQAENRDKRTELSASEALPIQPMPTSLPEGVQLLSLDDPATLHNAIANAVGEPEARIEPSPSPTLPPTIRRRV